VSENKMGTQHARELCQTFRTIAETSPFTALNERLVSIANELETICTKLYFKTQKGTEDMEQIVSEMGGIPSKVAACTDAKAAQSLCGPLLEKLEKVMHHAKTMKVRMT
jgi:hypothetical protein